MAAAILKADAKDTVDNFDEKVQEIHQAKQRSKGVALESLTGIQKIILPAMLVWVQVQWGFHFA